MNMVCRTSYVKIHKVLKVNMFYYIYILYFISFLHINFLLVLHAYVSLKSIDCILLSSLAFNAILLTSSLNRLCFSLLNLYCIFITNLFFYKFCDLFEDYLHQFYFFLGFIFNLSCF